MAAALQSQSQVPIAVAQLDCHRRGLHYREHLARPADDRDTGRVEAACSGAGRRADEDLLERVGLEPKAAIGIPTPGG